jgi:L-aspartate oxidase
MDRLINQGPIIVGAGLAGLSAALAAAPRPVIVLSAAMLGHGCSSAWAQGGVAAALAQEDSPQMHAADTMAAGAGLCDLDPVTILTQEGPHAVDRLAALGAPFDRHPDGRYVQGLEAAHSRARVARVGGDGAGRAIMSAVISAVQASPLVRVMEQAVLVGLLKSASGVIRGVLAEVEGKRVEIIGTSVILATGGIGGLYAVTTVPVEVRGQGLAIAALAGARIRDPEFVQFHPTAIDVGQDPAPLATEALRGEGAKLVNSDGRAFMSQYHVAAELAPRDVVARAIHAERKASRGAFLDAREAVGEHFPHEFPAVFAACMAAGIDPRLQPIPVVPAVHYHMGGIGTDLNGATNIPGLYAAGECAATGVQGANRLASNSLLEAAVFGTRAGRAAARMTPGSGTEFTTIACGAPLEPEALQILRRSMSRYAGVIRNAAGLVALETIIEGLEWAHGPAPELLAARLVAYAALARTESRGGHFRSDFPLTSDEPQSTWLNLADVQVGQLQVA